MADNVTLDAGAGGDTIAADDVGGVKYQVVKLDVGGDGVAAPVSNSNPVPVSDAGGVLTVDGTVAVTNAGLTELAAAINASSQVDVNIAASAATVTVSNAGLTELAAAINASSQLDVNVAAGTVAVTHAALTELGAAIDTELQVDVVGALPAGTNNIGDVDIASIAAGDNNIGNVDVASLPASTNTLEVVGDVADDAAAAGNPVLIAGVAVEMDGTDPTTVSAEGDAARLRTDRARRLLVSEHHPRSFFTSADYAAAQTNTSIQAAPGAGLSLYITDIVISNGATAGNITLLDGSGGTVKFEIYPAINGGVSISLRQPIRLTANTALVITSTTVTTHSLNIGGYIAP